MYLTSWPLAIYNTMKSSWTTINPTSTPLHYFQTSTLIAKILDNSFTFAPTFATLLLNFTFHMTNNIKQWLFIHLRMKNYSNVYLNAKQSLCPCPETYLQRVLLRNEPDGFLYFKILYFFTVLTQGQISDCCSNIQNLKISDGEYPQTFSIILYCCFQNPTLKDKTNPALLKKKRFFYWCHVTLPNHIILFAINVMILIISPTFAFNTNW